MPVYPYTDSVDNPSLKAAPCKHVNSNTPEAAHALVLVRFVQERTDCRCHNKHIWERLGSMVHSPNSLRQMSTTGKVYKLHSALTAQPSHGKPAILPHLTVPIHFQNESKKNKYSL